MIKSKRRAGHVAGIGDRRDAYTVLMGNLRARDQLEERGIDGRIILKWSFLVNFLSMNMLGYYSSINT
jgi:hypothetical protein